MPRGSLPRLLLKDNPLRTASTLMLTPGACRLRTSGRKTKPRELQPGQLPVAEVRLQCHHLSSAGGAVPLRARPPTELGHLGLVRGATASTRPPVRPRLMVAPVADGYWSSLGHLVCPGRWPALMFAGLVLRRLVKLRAAPVVGWHRRTGPGPASA